METENNNLINLMWKCKNLIVLKPYCDRIIFTFRINAYSNSRANKNKHTIFIL